MSVDRADPGRGDPAGMLAASRERASKAATVRAAQVEMRRAAAEADPSVWSGASRESFIVAAAAAATELETLASRWEAESAALSTYGSGVQEVQDQQRIMQLRRAAAEGDLKTARTDLQSATLDLQTSYWATGGDTEEARRLLDRANEIFVVTSQRSRALEQE